MDTSAEPPAMLETIAPGPTALVAMPLGPEARTAAGLAWNFVRQPGEQNKYSWPACSALNRAVARLTFIPHTGSTAMLALGCSVFVFAFSIFVGPESLQQIALGETASLLDTPLDTRLDTRRVPVESRHRNERYG